MMTDEECRLIDTLFNKLAEAEKQSPPREAAAEALITRHLKTQPAAPYYMAQALLVQEQALQVAQARIASLEQQATRQASGGGFLAGLFGGGHQAPPSPRSYSRPAYAPQAPQGGPWASGSGGPVGGYAPPSRSGGFLAGAAQTAMGVAGGVLIADLIGDLFTGHGVFNGGGTEVNEVTNIFENPTDPGLGNNDADFSDPGFDGFDGGWDSNSDI